MLPDEEGRVIDRVRHRRTGVVVEDGDLGSVRVAQTDAGAFRIGQRQAYGLVAFDEVVVHDQNPEGFARLARGERQAAFGDFVIALL